MAVVQEVYSYYPFSATGNVKASACALAGITVSTAGNITVYDDASTGTTRPVLAITAVTAGQYLALPAGLSFGCYIVTTATGTAWIA
jgi:hypothetical protein